MSPATAADHRWQPAEQLWDAPTAAPGGTGPDATVLIPGSKSLTNRALVLAAQATGPSALSGALASRDTELMAGALRALGIGVDLDADSAADASTAPGPAHVPQFLVRPAPPTGPATIDCGLAGTVMRFVPPLAATAAGTVTLDGDEHARRRPMRVLLDALRGLGARVDGDALPVRVHGTGGLAGGAVALDASSSSQFVSGLLLSGAGYADGLTVTHVGPSVPSLPHIEMTVAALRGVGVVVDDSIPDRWRVEPGPVAPWPTPIEPDLSNATPFLAAAALLDGRVAIPGWPDRTTQPGDAFRGILAAFGVPTQLRGGTLTVTGTGRLDGVDLDLHDVGELTPTVVALALFATGPSRLRGIGHLRGHETDRLAALVANITALGGDARETADGLLIRPTRLTGGRWPSWADHRMATAGALVGLRVPGVQVSDIATTAKTLPGFQRMWAGMLGTGRH